MSVTVKQLSKAIVKNKDIDLIVRDQLSTIDAALLRAHSKWGDNVVKHEISNAFNFVGLERAQAEKIIYSKIMRSLEKRGFKVRIILGHDKSVLYITWTTGIADLDQKQLESYIFKRTAQSEDDITKPKLSIDEM
jgi:hypothetical protein